MHTDMKFSDMIRFILLVVLELTAVVGFGQHSGYPKTLDEHIDVLAAISAGGGSVETSVREIGSSFVPLASQKLMRSLSEGASPQGAGASTMLDMPSDDQQRANLQIGLAGLIGTALRELALNSETRREALDAIYSTLKSPYMISRRSALYAIGSSGDVSSVDEVLPLLEDKALSNRVIAAKTLLKIGDISTAAKIEKVLEKRRRGLTAEQVEKDGSFRHGYAAIKELMNKSNAPQSQARSPSASEQSIPLATMPRPAASPSPAAIEAAEKPASTVFPIVPVIIVALVIVGVVVFLLRRKVRA